MLASRVFGVVLATTVSALLAAATPAAAAGTKPVRMTSLSVSETEFDALPPPPGKLGATPGAGPNAKGPIEYQNRFTGIPDRVGAPAARITIRGQHDLNRAGSGRGGRLRR